MYYMQHIVIHLKCINNWTYFSKY